MSTVRAQKSIIRPLILALFSVLLATSTAFADPTKTIDGDQKFVSVKINGITVKVVIGDPGAEQGDYYLFSTSRSPWAEPSRPNWAFGADSGIKPNSLWPIQSMGYESDFEVMSRLDIEQSDWDFGTLLGEEDFKNLSHLLAASEVRLVQAHEAAVDALADVDFVAPGRIRALLQRLVQEAKEARDMRNERLDQELSWRQKTFSSAEGLETLREGVKLSQSQQDLLNGKIKSEVYEPIVKDMGLKVEDSLVNKLISYAEAFLPYTELRDKFINNEAKKKINFEGLVFALTNRLNKIQEFADMDEAIEKPHIVTPLLGSKNIDGILSIEESLSAMLAAINIYSQKQKGKVENELSITIVIEPDSLKYRSDFTWKQTVIALLRDYGLIPYAGALLKGARPETKSMSDDLRNMSTAEPSPVAGFQENVFIRYTPTDYKKVCKAALAKAKLNPISKDSWKSAPVMRVYEAAKGVLNRGSKPPNSGQ